MLAYWRSFQANLPLLGAENAAGITPAVPLLALWLVLTTMRQRARHGLPLVGPREGALDYPAAALLLAAAAWLMVDPPSQDGWYFWARRLDLLSLVLFLLAFSLLFWGVKTLWWYRLGVAYTLLVWPEFLVRLQGWVAEPLATLTSLVVRPLAREAGIRLAPVAESPNVFISAGPVSWGIVIGDVCSGLNAGLTIALVSIPAAVQLGLPWRRALPWIAGGVGLALASNVLRVLLLFVAAEHLGVGTALSVVHPVLGAVLLGIVFSLMWWRVPRARPAAGDAPGQTATTIVSSRNLAALGLGVVLFAAASARLAAFEPLPPIGPPGAPVEQPLDYVRLPEGWRYRGLSELAWQNLFGPSSRSYAASFLSNDGTLVKVQLVTTPDREKLRAFGLEACRVYHGDDVLGRRTVDLEAGGVAYLIDTWDRTPGSVGRLSVLYWEAPITLQGREAHARMALFLVQADEHLLPAQAVNGIAPGGREFDRADTVLVELARAMSREIIRSAV